MKSILNIACIVAMSTAIVAEARVPSRWSSFECSLDSGYHGGTVHVDKRGGGVIFMDNIKFSPAGPNSTINGIVVTGNVTENNRNSLVLVERWWSRDETEVVGYTTNTISFNDKENEASISINWGGTMISGDCSESE